MLLLTYMPRMMARHTKPSNLHLNYIKVFIKGSIMEDRMLARLTGRKEQKEKIQYDTCIHYFLPITAAI